MSPHVSVVIPTYNGTRFIRGALESVFAQTQPPTEIIVVDDASTDGTGDLIEAIAKDSNIPLTLIRFTKNCGGPARPLNAGIEAASCELVAILEQDDVMAARRIECQSTAASQHPECALIIGRPALVVDTGGELVWEPIAPPRDLPQFAEHAEGASFVIPSAHAFRALMSTNFIYSNSNVMLRRTPCRNVGGFDDRWRINSDADLEFRMLMVSPVAVTNTVVCGYRSRADSLYHSRYDRARIDGLLIRLKWGARRWDWAASDVRRVYWALRAEGVALLRRGELRRALQVFRALGASGVAWRHAASKIGMTPFERN